MSTCEKCNGSGHRLYPNTAGWDYEPGKIVGQAMTRDTCELCWGTGDESNPGYNLREVREYAVEAHYGQTYGPFTYGVHLRNVARVLTRFGHYGNRYIVCAYLHDIVEDTKVTLEDIESRYDAAIARIVDFLTDESGDNRKDRKRATYEKYRQSQMMDPDELKVAVAVKLADRIANIQNCLYKSDGDSKILYEMYRKENEAFLQALPTVQGDEMVEEISRLLQLEVRAQTKGGTPFSMSSKTR